MALLARDRISLQDYVQMNWMHRYLAVQALAHAGTDKISGPLAEKALALYYPEKTFQERVRIVEEVGEKARVQGIMVAKIFAEFVAALEDTGAFLRAIHRRKVGGGILANNLSYKPQEVKEFYDTVLSSPGGLPKMLGFPEFRRLGIKEPSIRADVRASYKEAPRRIRQIAALYRKQGRRTVLKLNTGRVRPDFRHFVHILIRIRKGLRQSAPSGQKPNGTFIIVYNKIKHGFNVLEATDKYARLPNKPESLEVVRASLSWDKVRPLIENVGTMAVLCNRLAQVTLHLDDEGAI